MLYATLAKVLFVHNVAYQEAPLTLRGQHGRCRNIWELQRLAHVFLWVYFYGWPWQTPAACEI